MCVCVFVGHVSMYATIFSQTATIPLASHHSVPEHELRATTQPVVSEQEQFCYVEVCR